MNTVQPDLERPAVPTMAPGAAKPGGKAAPAAQGEPTTLLAVRSARSAQREATRHVTNAELREHAAVVRAGLWGVALSTLGVLVVSALMGLMRG